MNNEAQRFEIEEGVELYESKSFTRPMSPDSIRLFNTFMSMNVGDSFVIPNELLSRVSYTARKAGVTVATRKESNDSIRIWRTA